MIRFLNRIEKPAVAIQFLAGAFLVYHGWSGTPANFFPFLFGLWMLLDVRLHLIQTEKPGLEMTNCNLNDCCIHDRNPQA